jgi:cytochrome c-type biogenesis protein CcmH/NrfF
VAGLTAASRTARAWIRRPAAGLAALLLLALGGLAVAARGPAPAATPAEQVHAIATGLRCPVCRDLSVADSPAPLARQMRDRIAEGLAAGKSPETIRREFVDAYGESVLLVPARRGAGLVPWVAPALVLAGGLLAAVLALRRWRGRAGAATAGPPSTRTSSADRLLLERALARIDEEAP